MAEIRICLPLENLAGLETPRPRLLFSAGFCQPGKPCANFAKLPCLLPCSCSAQIPDNCYALPPSQICNTKVATLSIVMLATFGTLMLGDFVN